MPASRYAFVEGALHVPLQGPSSSGRRREETLAAAAVLVVLSAAAIVACYRQGSILFYGDAEAHLNIARRILDSRTPGLRQVGTVWLPLPHLAMLPFVQSDLLWETGLAGAIPSAIAFIAAGLFLFGAARRLFGATAPAAATLLAFALNPNLLYLQSTPMTQPLFFAMAAALFYCLVRLRGAETTGWLVGAGVAGAACTLTRYEGWFLLPFATVFVGGVARRPVRASGTFAAVAGLGPLLWLAHNLWFWGDPLEFYRGPYSALASYARSLASGSAPYRGDHDWRAAWLYYRTAVKDCLGWPLLALGFGGCVAAARRRGGWVTLLLLVPPPLFYVWTLHSGGIPIFVPELWPNSLYNVRYGLAALPLFALAAGALVATLPTGWRTPVVALGALLLAGSELAQGPAASICWQEARATSEPRRQATDEAATFLRSHYRAGDGIVMSFGDLTGILREAGIPLREALIQDNVPYWQRVVAEPASQLRESWAVTSSGDPVDGILTSLGKSASRYHCVDKVTEQGGPTVQICRRG